MQQLDVAFKPLEVDKSLHALFDEDNSVAFEEESAVGTVQQFLNSLQFREIEKVRPNDVFIEMDDDTGRRGVTLTIKYSQQCGRSGPSRTKSPASKPEILFPTIRRPEPEIIRFNS